MDESEYLSMLDKGLAALPEHITKHDRFVVPEVQLLTEGNKTFIKNFRQIVEKLARDPKHFLKFIVNEVGTAGIIDEQSGRAILTGVFTKKAVTDAIDAYTKEFVICKTCARPDTTLDKQARQAIVVCQACGAKHPVRKL
jgi:translation initiation factor 2 subunit 2